MSVKTAGSLSRGLIILVLFAWNLTSCCAGEKPKLPLSIKKPSPTEMLNRESGSVRVEVWVDQPYPEQGEQIVLHGSLIKDQIRIGAISMEGYWPSTDQPSVLPNCRVQVIYGSGVCNVDTKAFETGQAVNLRVKFVYEGRTYWGSTEIVPR